MAGGIPIPFGEYLPDLAELDNPGTPTILNAMPHLKDWKSFPSLSVYSNALTARNQGAISVKDKDGIIYIYAGDASKLYALTSASFADVSKVGGYTVANDAFWDFTKWGQNLIATQLGDAVQIIALGGANFADMITSTLKPKAKCVAVVRDFVMLGHTNDATDGLVPNRAWWSGINDETDFDPAASTQCDFQNLEGTGGAIQRIIGGEYGIIFQEHAIVRASYVGAPFIFQLDEIVRNRGAACQGGVAWFDRFAFFLSDDGFYLFDGIETHPIGANKVDKTFYNDLDQSFLHRLIMAIDPSNKLLAIAYPGVGNVNGRPNKILLYNWSSRRWGPVALELEYIFADFTKSTDMDSMDSLYSDLDAVPFSLDSRVWTGGARLLSAFDSNHKLSYFTGSALAATLETKEVQFFTGYCALVNKLRALVEGTDATITAQVGHRETLNEAVTWDPAVAMEAGGDFPVMNENRYHRFRLNVSGGFGDAIGVEADAEQAGEF